MLHSDPLPGTPCGRLGKPMDTPAPAHPIPATLEAAGVELTGLKIAGPLTASTLPAASTQPWLLEPLAGANGSIRAKIVDAHLIFDADVTVPVGNGRIDFNQATVEHVGPDSRMGVSRMGLYVDAPNGRSYLFQFSSPPVAGVEYEKARGMLGPFSADRGHLQLQPFIEWLLRQPTGAHLLGLTEQARLLFDRTAASGEVRLGDGRFAAGGIRGELAGRAEGRNVVRIHSDAVGRGITLEVSPLLLRKATIDVAGLQCRCEEITGAVTLRVTLENGQMHFAVDLAKAKLAGLRVGPAA